MADIATIPPQLQQDPNYLKFIQDPETGLQSRIKDIKGTLPIEEYRRLEQQKIQEMQQEYLNSQNNQSRTSSEPTRFGRSFHKPNSQS